MDKKKQVEQLVEELNKYAFQYYVLDNPSISDKQYDQKYDNLIQLEKETEYILPNSPSQRVGDTILKGFEKIQHRNKLWSLDKAQSKEAVLEFIMKCDKFVMEYNRTHTDKLPRPKYVVTKKFDGLTINCTYDENGTLIKSGTRGTGEVGESILEQTKTILNMPKQINMNTIGQIDVHGEAMMTKNAFKEYNEHLKPNETPLKNLRNGAAGALRNLNVKECARRKLVAQIYDLSYSEKQFDTYVETLEFMKDKGFSVDEYIVCNTFEEIDKAIDNIGDIRQSLQFDIDGVVIAIDNLKTRELMGYTEKFPRWAIAFKFEAEETTTKLLDVEFNVGRTGRINPRGILETVELCGVTVKYATLNNMDDIARKGVKINSDIFIRRSNDVIPEVLGVVEESLNNEDVIDILPPTHCPSCGSELIQDGVFYYCENTLGCKPQLMKNINHFAKREAMNIVGVSEKTIQQLMDANILNTIVDLYRLKDRKVDMLKLERFAEKKVNNLIEAIEQSRKCKLNAFVYALGIPNVGEKTSKDLAKTYNNLESIMSVSVNDLIKIEDIGDIVASSVYEYFHNEKNIEMIKELLEYIKFEVEEKKIDSSLKDLTGMTFVITGDVHTFKNRDEFKSLVESLNGKVSGSVSKKTNYLVNNDIESTTGKNQKAKELNVPVINEEQFNELIGRVV